MRKVSEAVSWYDSSKEEYPKECVGLIVRGEFSHATYYEPFKESLEAKGLNFLDDLKCGTSYREQLAVLYDADSMVIKYQYNGKPIVTSNVLRQYVGLSASNPETAPEADAGFQDTEISAIKTALNDSISSIKGFLIIGNGSKNAKVAALNKIKNTIESKLKDNKPKQEIIQELKNFAAKANEYRLTKKTTTSFRLFKQKIADALPGQVDLSSIEKENQPFKK